MPTDAGKTFFEFIRDGFEHAPTTGTVQIISEEPRQRFFITVEKSSIAYVEGTAASPTSTITMRANVIGDLVAKAEFYDSRVVEFSSRLSFAGDKKLAKFLLDLVMRPSAAVTQQLAIAKEISRKHPTYQVERVHCPEKRFIQEAIADFRPVLMTGVLDDWAVSSWNAKALESRFGRYQVVSYLPWTIRNYTMASAIKYTGGVGLPGVLRKHFRPPAALQSATTLGFPQLWLGSPESQRKAVTGLHCDCVHGFLCHVFGRKKVLLYSPDQEALVYPFRAFNMYRSCWTGPDAIDYDRYPLFRQARPIEVVLNPGEVLFIPFGWFHCIFALDSVMSISYPVGETTQSDHFHARSGSVVSGTSEPGGITYQIDNE